MPRIVKQKHVRRKTHLRAFKVGSGLPTLGELVEEIHEYTATLLGRRPPPYNPRYTEALMECADAYFARASEITMLIQQAEREGRIVRSSPFVKFRTGELRSFMEMAKRAADLGSRRITVRQMEADAARRGRDSLY